MTSLRHLSYFLALGLFWGISPSLYRHWGELGMPVSHVIFLTGTGVSGMLRALEQSWGRDPQTMLPDVRFTPHPNMTDGGGPFVERGE